MLVVSFRTTDYDVIVL